MTDKHKKLSDTEIKALLTPPFRYECGCIWDSEGHMVLDEHGHEVRGWGRLQYVDHAEAKQDGIGERIAQILSQYWEDYENE